ncbi:uncharacterized PE-PGRS family protein PE_PGRS54-like [Condylostylus longicornis]|uniref:uncharacterized PE-PGRS family protein PE_PGRS54-like n=1 Tax=Condylostylus longicornis TaxID=2530218 RepID=UPI00244DC73A|nr:uncharacterized PE-PGRS family protein PE_PGRS54-like [Condylostylus longicornis]
MKVLLCLVLLTAGTNATFLNLFGGGGNRGLNGGVAGPGVGPGGPRPGVNGNNEIRHVRILTPIPVVPVQGNGIGAGGVGGVGGVAVSSGYGGAIGRANIGVAGGIGPGGPGGPGLGAGIAHGRGGLIGGVNANEVIVVRLIHENAGGHGPIDNSIAGIAGGAIANGRTNLEQQVVRIIHENAGAPTIDSSGHGLVSHHGVDGQPEERVIRIIHQHTSSETSSSLPAHHTSHGHEQVVRVIHEEEHEVPVHSASHPVSSHISSTSELLPPLPPAVTPHHSYLPPHHNHHHDHF